MKYVIIINALKNNRGSEALIKGLLTLLPIDDSSNEIIIAAGNGKIDNTFKGVSKILPRYSVDCFSKFKCALLKLFRFDLTDILKVRCRRFLSEINNQTIAIVIGADNYDASYNLSKEMRAINTLIFEKKPFKTIILNGLVILSSVFSAPNTRQ